MAPPASALMPGVTASGHVTGAIGAIPPVPGMFSNMLNPLTTGQFPPISLMPMQAMTQQATRHARQVYVGGLSPNANEQWIHGVCCASRRPVCILPYHHQIHSAVSACVVHNLVDSCMANRRFVDQWRSLIQSEDQVIKDYIS